ncbi:Trehalose synthase/amylase TreS [Andreprevotia sp. IGB-42]|uniref:maltose alpha-D-glucosyltransferase n=1 Tax=Andreprevotia sp. IGB-42 TaxID=2497473 RepID=UPI001358FF2D|nr:maltose alpha-D-glucosyltransferase [Andreprevotia sp. IGB-42]KAF0813336.1 Trehalose synthase/amylase TreS [Andreprevotia sp. IGB-42]
MSEQAPQNSSQDDNLLWYKDAIIYQLHVKSFFDGNNDGIGDFPGLIAKLDYIASLGVDAVWLLPFYPSPRRDDGYDIAEYQGVHPDYGTMADVRHFIAEAHRRGLRVITDLVLNHTSDQHGWFQRARTSPKGSNYRNFYVWSDDDQKYAGTRIIFSDTEKSNWTWDPVAGQYYWHRFFFHQPDLNYDNPRVLEAVMKVIHFWLKMGVDGFRLDAVSYLIEREGTLNEHLPETHGVLKKIRAYIDANFPGRMLLAEANAWPEDMQQYFGDDDECQLAFHFPLMPRMYMAIAREDRFPIADIMRQTPAIPPNSQWAIFLRNHDELTLEMVTDSERDYLWETYASDRRARLNLGIRRRLAPLLERDRRRIELMNGLLLSMPGTPVMYYGDEIGMGDNFHLGDRDGVRTPMQWSPDRNGGFSLADPEQLVLPAIMGTLYGYESVNVEAQTRDAHSLLSTMRRMIAVRRQHHVFGRGTIRFLHPRNRKILAYLRERDGDTPILCVVNLSRNAQAAELELSEFAGCIPVELMGGAAFPAVGQLSYLLTMPPYGFFWLELSSSAAKPGWGNVPEPQQLELRTLVWRAQFDGVAALLAPGSENRRVLDSEVLPAYLGTRPWYAGKPSLQNGAAQVQLAYTVKLGRARNGTDLLLGELQLAGDVAERYFLPLGVVWDAPGQSALPEQFALSRVRRGRELGYLTDAVVTEDFGRAVMDGLKSGLHLPLENGSVIEFQPDAAADELTIAEGEDIRWISVSEARGLIVVGTQAVIRPIRDIQPGELEETELIRYLAAGGFTNVPSWLGRVVRRDQQGQTHTLMVIHRYVRNQGFAYHWLSENLRRTLSELVINDQPGSHAPDHHAAVPQVDQAGWFIETLSGITPFMESTGRAAAAMHALFARDTDNTAFKPEPATLQHAQQWADAAATALRKATDTLAAMRSQLSEAGQQRLEQLCNTRIDDVLLAVAKHAADGQVLTRIHGQLGLDHVLIALDQPMFVGFGGQESHPAADQQRAKSSPLWDIACLLQSLDAAVDHASTQLLHGNLPPQIDSQVLLDAVRSALRNTVVNAYLAARGDEIALVPPALLALFELTAEARAVFDAVATGAEASEQVLIRLERLIALLVADAAAHGEDNRH